MEPRRVELMSSKALDKTKKSASKQSGVSMRLEVTLDLEENSCPEFHYPTLLSEKYPDFVEDENPEEQAKTEKLALEYERKYGKPGKNQKRFHPGDGYDNNDPFIDDGEDCDEMVQLSMVTEHGGFYINKGKLKTKHASYYEANPDVEEVKPKKKRKKNVIHSDDEDENEPKPKAKKRVKNTDKTSIKPKASRPKLANKAGNGAEKKMLSVAPRKRAIKGKDKDKDNNLINSTEKKMKADQYDSVISDVINKASNRELSQQMSKEQPEQEDSNTASMAQPVLPKLSEPAMQILAELKESMTDSSEGKKKYFGQKVNDRLLELDFMLRPLAPHQRSKVYAHMALFMPVNKDTLMKRVRALQSKNREDQIKGPLDKLKGAIQAAMGESIRKHNVECEHAKQKALELKEKGEATNDVDVEYEGGARPDCNSPKKELEDGAAKGDGATKGEGPEKKRAPTVRKKFVWTKDTETLLCTVVRVQLDHCIKVKGQSEEDYVKEFLEKEVRNLWPKGWMQTRTLFLKCKGEISKISDNQAKLRKAYSVTSTLSNDALTFSTNQSIVAMKKGPKTAVATTDSKMATTSSSQAPGPSSAGPSGVGPSGVGPSGAGPSGVGPSGVGQGDKGEVSKKEANEDPFSNLKAAMGQEESTPKSISDNNAIIRFGSSATVGTEPRVVKVKTSITERMTVKKVMDKPTTNKNLVNNNNSNQSRPVSGAATMATTAGGTLTRVIPSASLSKGPGKAASSTAGLHGTNMISSSLNKLNHTVTKIISSTTAASSHTNTPAPATVTKSNPSFKLVNVMPNKSHPSDQGQRYQPSATRVQANQIAAKAPGDGTSQVHRATHGVEKTTTRTPVYLTATQLQKVTAGQTRAEASQPKPVYVTHKPGMPISQKGGLPPSAGSRIVTPITSTNVHNIQKTAQYVSSQGAPTAKISQQSKQNVMVLQPGQVYSTSQGGPSMTASSLLASLQSKAAGQNSSPNTNISRNQMVQIKPGSLAVSTAPQLISNKNPRISSTNQVTRNDSSGTSYPSTVTPVSYRTIPAGTVRVSSPNTNRVSTPNTIRVSAPSSIRVSVPNSVRVSVPNSVRMSAPNSVRMSAPNSVRMSAPNSVRVSAPASARMTAPSHGLVADHTMRSLHSAPNVRSDGSSQPGTVHTLLQSRSDHVTSQPIAYYTQRGSHTVVGRSTGMESVQQVGLTARSLPRANPTQINNYMKTAAVQKPLHQSTDNQPGNSAHQTGVPSNNGTVTNRDQAHHTKAVARFPAPQK